jgi:hypothetical protein
MLFPYQFEEDGIHYSCDDMNICWSFNEETQESCTYEGECYSVEGALEVYFEGSSIDAHGIVWGEALGWCSSDLNELIDGTYSVEECWAACTNQYSDTVAVDFYHLEDECYCQSECSCLAEVGEEGQMLMTAHWIDYLPETCDEEEYFNEPTYWGTGNGWCMSDLDESPGNADDIDTCWSMCVAEYGETEIFAVELNGEGGSCYC